MTIGTWWLIFMIVSTAILDVWLYVNKTTKGDTITERIRQLPLKIQFLMILLIGILIGHLFWH